MWLSNNEQKIRTTYLSVLYVYNIVLPKIVSTKANNDEFEYWLYF